MLSITRKKFNYNYNYNYKLIFVLFILGFWCLSSNAATFQIQSVSSPSSSDGGVFSAEITSANYSDPTPNYCYQKTHCFYAGFVGNNFSYDSAEEGSRENIAQRSKTMGDLAADLKSSGLFTRMTSVGSSPDQFCMYPAQPGLSDQIVNRIPGLPPVSNCLPVPPVRVSCHLTPESVDFEWEGKVKSTSFPERAQDIQVTCTGPADVRLSVHTGYINLVAGNLNWRAEFNIDSQGWRGVATGKVDVTKTFTMVARIVGSNDYEGVFRASSALFLEII